MNESQVYKWFWEQRNKEEERKDEAKMAALKDFSDLSEEQKFEVFINKTLQKHKDLVYLRGEDGAGRSLTEDELMGSVKLHCQAIKKMTDYDELAKEVNFDVEKAALKICEATNDPAQLTISIVQQMEDGEHRLNQEAQMRENEDLLQKIAMLRNASAPSSQNQTFDHKEESEERVVLTPRARNKHEDSFYIDKAEEKQPSTPIRMVENLDDSSCNEKSGDTLFKQMHN